MNLEDIQEKIRKAGKKMKLPYRSFNQREIDILAMTIKLNEEVGELCNEILSVLRLQRKSKLEKFDKRNFYDEFGDVIITTILLANVSGVDIEKATLRKLKKVEEKYVKDH